MDPVYPVILCGGAGTRLWPASRSAFPKQFAKLVGPHSLFQMTLRRFAGPDFAAPLVMTENEFRFMATEQCAQIGLADARVVVEPARRDTAPAILAAALLLEDTPDAFMLVAPSDHIIGDLSGFLDAVRVARTAAQDHGALVTFGVTPIRAETGYGYLELPQIPEEGTAASLTSFREKPDLETAKAMLTAENYLWNAGIFLFRVHDIIAAYEVHAPDLFPPCRTAVSDRTSDLGFERLDTAYNSARAISFDYAIMEQAAPVMTVPLGSSWSDLGSWDALWQAAAPDQNGLATFGPVTAIDCKDSYLRSEDSNMRLVGLGLNNLVAVATRDAVLVADKSRVQDVKLVVETLRANNISQADTYPRFHRPWGWYETLSLGRRFQVKQIMVNPGGVLSLQSHHHRSEHWVVVEGTAEVTVEDKTRLVTENESVYIPLGTKHRMSNPGKLPMYLIEVQTGGYLGEDDIVRHDDIYNRA
jgi:mannose-1-phosphate guanylyltransferase/mannose-1-phosphate guanylyltransferase/mannose-6-phosphate isomerase